MEAWPDYNHHPLCCGLHWLQYCPAGVIFNAFGTKNYHTVDPADQILIVRWCRSTQASSIGLVGVITLTNSKELLLILTHSTWVFNDHIEIPRIILFVMNAIDENAYSQQELFGCSVNADAEEHNHWDSTSGLFAHIWFRFICIPCPPRASGFSPSSPSWLPCCRTSSSGKYFGISQTEKYNQANTFNLYFPKLSHSS